jgi:hypothetical protein
LGVSLAGGEHRKHPVQRAEEGIDGEMAHAGGGQLDRQRQTVQACTDRLDRANLGLAGAVVRAEGPDPLHEEGDRIRIGGKGRDRDLLLVGDAEADPAGGEDAQVRAGGQQLGDARRHGEQVLQIVEHEQGGLAAQGGDDAR